MVRTSGQQEETGLTRASAEENHWSPVLYSGLISRREAPLMAQGCQIMRTIAPNVPPSETRPPSVGLGIASVLTYGCVATRQWSKTATSAEQPSGQLMKSPNESAAVGTRTVA